MDNLYGEELVDKLDFRECSNNLEQKFNLLTDPVVELFSGAPNRGHVPISTTMKINCSGTQKNSQAEDR